MLLLLSAPGNTKSSAEPGKPFGDQLFVLLHRSLPPLAVHVRVPAELQKIKTRENRKVSVAFIHTCSLRLEKSFNRNTFERFGDGRRIKYKDISPQMATLTESSLRTRRSLISRLRDLDDAESWRTFFDTYWELLYNVARHSGLDDSAAQDVVQDTVIGVARRMPEFHYEPTKGSFKHWLLRIARRRIIDHFRRVYRQPPRAEHGLEALETEDPDAVSDPAAEQIDAAWEAEWERRVLRAAIEEIKREVNPKHFQIFDYAVIKEWPVVKIAQTLRVNAAQVYLARHRVARAVKRRANELRQNFQRKDGL